MTDGIVNEVISDFRRRSYGDCANETDVDEMLAELENVLSQRIRKEFNQSDIWGESLIRKKLVGDEY